MTIRVAHVVVSMAAMIGAQMAHATPNEDCVKLVQSSADQVKASCGTKEFKVTCSLGITSGDAAKVPALSKGCQDAAAAVAQKCSAADFKASVAKINLQGFNCSVRNKTRISTGGSILNVGYAKDDRDVGSKVVTSITNLAK